MSVARHHNEWLSLVDISGPFLSLPVLMRVFPQQLDALDADIARDTRLAFSEWEDAEGDRAVHHAWLRIVVLGRNRKEVEADGVDGHGTGSDAGDVA